MAANKRVEGPEPTGESDVPNTLLTFVDPHEQAAQHRVVLWAAAGQGKTVGACSAEGPILAVSADRPRAYAVARQLHPDKVIREVRYKDVSTLNSVYEYLRNAGSDVRTVILDPFQAIYDHLVETGPKRRDGEPNWQAINKAILSFLYSLREFPVNVVIVAHEKISEGEGKVYPAVGGPSLINKILAESDIVAHVERVAGEGDEVRYEAQLQPSGPLVCKDATGYGLGDRRALDLSEWFSHQKAAGADLPWEGPEVGAQGYARKSVTAEEMAHAADDEKSPAQETLT